MQRKGKYVTEMRKWVMAVLSLEGNSGHPEPYKQSLCGLVTNY